MIADKFSAWAPEQILKRRCAGGEISRDEYHQKLKGSVADEAHIRGLAQLSA